MVDGIKSIYVIGSMRNKEIPEVAKALRSYGYDVFDDWYSVGPEADDYWRDHERFKGHTYLQAIEGYAAKNVFDFDLRNLDRCDAGVLVLPAGRSGHMEIGYLTGKGKKTFIIMDDPERWDIMNQFVFLNGGRIFENRQDAEKYFAG